MSVSVNEDVSPTRPLWGNLRPGPYRVGYRVSWLTDHSRVYDPPYAPGAEAPPQPRPRRPILMARWYPAEPRDGAAPLKQTQYLDLPELGAAAPPGFRERLTAHCRSVSSEEVAGKPRADWGDAERAAVAAFFAVETAAFRDAPPAPGSFPVIVNHPGLGGAFADNSVLLEYLASHGYVVVTSAYQSEEAHMVNIDWDLTRSTKDLGLLVNAFAAEPNTDIHRLGAMGHSYGAQAVLAWQATENAPVRATACLDTTAEYSPPDSDGFAPLREAVKKSHRSLTPLLVFTTSRREPNYYLYESLRFAERYYLRAADLGHNDFLCHGAFGAQQRGQAELRATYDAVCETVLRFFDATLKGDEAAREATRTLAQSGPVAEGKYIGGDGYTPSAAPSPTPKQVGDRAREHGVPAALTVAEPYVTAGFDPWSAAEVGNVLRKCGRPELAVAFLEAASSWYPDSEPVRQALNEARQAQASGESEGVTG